ncbi:MAG: VIT and VWA domain-containing protein [Verrucomicrobia bacterium]|nr:VIT and VWA domain-containing protein [Verrucomicrobiota bacterium]MCG2681805.1 VIT and VWA domain-containing protein [Kiritimatiellia bacterium]MBU4247286.1 VIT and VWA domain-containing protein [Verrucomicrobiota bacterium]MBU4289902.1 VIT and VWA domain-containing protein [Verrucomicrobiota bacterium]MBU4427954.1 VIT and VWA domain-containing protein [Verrucomicrobiota bacterium]
MNRILTGLAVLGLMLGGWLGNVALADGFIYIHDQPFIRPHPPYPHHPHPMPPPHYAFAPLEVKYHHVTVKIQDQVAVTEVDQTFFNPNNQQLEGTYMFPVPRGAQVDKFSMDINGKQVEAELLDADKARKIYEDIVRKMKDPALLEYAGQSLFKLRIFPIEPRSEKRIKLQYTHLLRNDNGLVEYLYPLNTEKFSAAPVKSVALKVELECKQPIKSVYSPSHPVEIKRPADRRATIGYEAKDVKPDTDFLLFFSATAKSDIGLNLQAYNDGADPAGGCFALLVAPTAEITADKIVEKDIVFVLDTSGSMAENNKIDQARKALQFCLKNLNQGDRFEIVRFSTEAEPLFGKLAENTDQNKIKAEEYVKELKPIGGTAIEEALIKALDTAKGGGDKDRPCFIVFLTDGRPTIGNTDEDQIVAQVSKAMGGRSIRIFCFGIGADINTHLLDKIAEKTRAVSRYVLPGEDIEVKVSNFYTKISQPVLANLKLKFSGAIKAAKMHPGEIPDLFKGEQLVVFGRYSGSGDAAIILEGAVNGQAKTFTYEASFPAKATEYVFIPRLWATRRVGFLLDEIRLRGENKEVRDEVTELARKYGVVTPYTAYLIVEDESRRNVPVTSRSMQAMNESDDLRHEGRRLYDEMAAAKSGDAAVGGAQATESLRSANEVSAPARASSRAWGGQKKAMAASPVIAKVQATIQAQQSRYVRGRTFYRNGDQWIDANVPSHPDAKKSRVKFNSDEYFALLSKHVDAAQWLAVGCNVQLYLDDTIYEIVESDG